MRDPVQEKVIVFCLKEFLCTSRPSDKTIR